MPASARLEFGVPSAYWKLSLSHKTVFRGRHLTLQLLRQPTSRLVMHPLHSFWTHQNATICRPTNSLKRACAPPLPAKQLGAKRKPFGWNSSAVSRTSVAKGLFVAAQRLSSLAEPDQLLIAHFAEPGSQFLQIKALVAGEAVHAIAVGVL